MIVKIKLFSNWKRKKGEKVSHKDWLARKSLLKGMDIFFQNTILKIQDALTVKQKLQVYGKIMKYKYLFISLCLKVYTELNSN